jgi:uncharacterized membrane protein
LQPLSNATYNGILDGPVVLTDGRFEGEPFMPASAARPVVRLVPDAVAGGDLTGDGHDEAVVALAHNAGGSGEFVYLAVVRNGHEGPENFATIGLGDRVRIITLEIADGRLIADLVVHAPDDPMCCPSRRVRRQWSFEGGEPVSLQQAGGRFRGHLVWGHESRRFSSCDGGREGWVINAAGDELVEVYEELTSAPYQPMFVEVRGAWIAAPTQGFGTDYAQALRIDELLRAENEGFGCRLVLDGVLFIASGNEPFWRLRIGEDGISMRSMEAPDERRFGAPQMRREAERVVFEGEHRGSAIRVTLDRRRCIDTMSGARYSWAASVDLDGKQLTGCAAEGL